MCLYDLYEETITSLRINAEAGRTVRSKAIKSYFSSVNRQGKLLFRSTSQYTPGLTYVQNIRPKNRPSKSHGVKDFRELYNKDIYISCSCPDFLYAGYKYIASTNDFLVGVKERRFPSIRNPQLKGTVCKHLISVMKVLKFNIPSVYVDFKKFHESVEDIMPAYISKKYGSEGEDYWNRAKKIARKNGQSKNYAYITKIFNTMIKNKLSTTDAEPVDDSYIEEGLIDLFLFG